MRLKYLFSGCLLLILSMWFLTLALHSTLDGNGLIIWPIFFSSLIIGIIFMIFTFKFEENKPIKSAFYLFIVALFVALLILLADFLGFKGNNTNFIPGLIFYFSTFLCGVGSGILSIIGFIFAMNKK